MSRYVVVVAPFLLCSLIAKADQEAESIERIHVVGERRVSHESPDMQQLLRNQGVNFSAAGGVSALPIMNGLMGDRISVRVDGAQVTAACANQMNPPLSYVSANQVAEASVIAGITPVSKGGDNIAGVIELNSIAPHFSDHQDVQFDRGEVGLEYRSNGNVRRAQASVSAASRNLYLAYSGAFEDADSYENGAGQKVINTLYRAQNHALSLAYQGRTALFKSKVSWQSIPYQGFPNQYMDMTDNRSVGITNEYEHQINNSNRLNVRLNYHHVEHEMGFFSAEKTGNMPMLTDSYDANYAVVWQRDLTPSHELLIGHEYYRHRLDDWWPPVQGMPMMSPDTYININDGQRDRLAFYAESNKTFSPQLSTNMGVRIEQVTTNADEVQPYNRMPMMGMANLDAMAADAFNDASRKSQDTLIDATLAATYQIAEGHQLELGLARKNRAPNLYERYSWGRSTMASTMIGWFGDGNGYIGNLSLDPETAHTLSLGYGFTSPTERFSWSVKPYVTRVDDFIDATVVGTINRSDEAAGQRQLLQFDNLDATLWGVDTHAHWQLADTRLGKWQLHLKASYVRGERRTSSEPLYQIQPLQAEASLQHRTGQFSNRITLQHQDTKHRVDPRRLENSTGSYQLLNVSSRYDFDQVAVTVSIDNLLDVWYELPLGGVSVADHKQDSTLGFNQLQGPGRSFNLSLSYRF